MKDEIDKTPMWVNRRVAQLKRDFQVAKHTKVTVRSAANILTEHFSVGSVIDHWGRNGSVFYCEPYGTRLSVYSRAESLANLLECKWRFGESRWNPPRTVRVEFYKPEEQV